MVKPTGQAPLHSIVSVLCVYRPRLALALALDFIFRIRVASRCWSPGGARQHRTCILPSGVCRRAGWCLFWKMRSGWSLGGPGWPKTRPGSACESDCRLLGDGLEAGLQISRPVGQSVPSLVRSSKESRWALQNSTAPDKLGHCRWSMAVIMDHLMDHD